MLRNVWKHVLSPPAEGFTELVTTGAFGGAPPIRKTLLWGITQRGFSEGDKVSDTLNELLISLTCLERER